METAQAKMFVRSLNNSAPKILVAFLFAGTALDVQDLREWTGLKRETIYDGLNILQSCGMVAKQVLEHGRTLWLPSGDFLPGAMQLSEKGTPALQESEKRTSVSLIGGGDSIKLINTDPPTPPSEQESEKRTPDDFPGALQILRQTDLLFDGSFVNSKGLEHCVPEEVLAWCAYAYQQFQRQRLDRPAGVVRKRLAEGEHASEKMRAGWLQILPEDFLEAVGGLIEFECDYCQESFATRQAKREHEEAAHPCRCLECDAWFLTDDELKAHYTATHDPYRRHASDEAEIIPIPTLDGSIEKLWQSVLGTLQQEMPRASFDTWVRDARAIRYDGNAVIAYVRNSYAKDWLTNRLTPRVTQLLTALLEKPTTVTFTDEVDA